MKNLILVVEDEEQIRKDIAKTLELSDYDTLTARNGREALKIALEKIPDLIISDIMMPELDGYELLNELQKYPDTIDIPFLFLSARSDKSDIRDGMNLGADDYITKPFDIDELIKSVETRLKKKTQSEQKFSKRFEDLRTNIRQNLPHEIRTPLSVIMGFTDLLRNSHAKMISEDIDEMLDNIRQSATRLNSLFENYLLYANLEIIATNQKETERLKNGKTVAPELVIKLIAEEKAAAAKRIKDLEVKLDESVVAMSEQYFVKIIEELAENAFKFSAPGSPVKINAVQKNNFYNISITDHGRGFTKQQISGIGAYVQFERKIYEQQGSGLGLSISKRIVELHGGQFEIISEPDKFTTITFDIPAVDIV